MMARFVIQKDSEEILLWRNDADSRNNFLESSEVSREEHESWLTKKLSSKLAKLIILEKGKDKIGIVRYEKEGDYSLVSINLNPKFRGKGYGSKLLLLSEEVLDFSNKKIIFKAHILKNNKPSISIFEKAGYELESDSRKLLVYKKIVR